MLSFISVFFILLSAFVIIYFLYLILSGNRLHLLLEFFFVIVYIAIFIIFLFPEILGVLEDFLGIQSAINFIIYLSIFTIFFLLFILYNKEEDQRKEITKLTREIALLKNSKKK